MGGVAHRKNHGVVSEDDKKGGVGLKPAETPLPQSRWCIRSEFQNFDPRTQTRFPLQSQATAAHLFAPDSEQPTGECQSSLYRAGV